MAAQLMDGLGSKNSEWDEHKGRGRCQGDAASCKLGREGKASYAKGRQEASGMVTPWLDSISQMCNFVTN